MAKSFVLSDESINSYGFRVITSGINLEQFRKNPVMLFNHDDTQVIGRWDNIRVEGTQLLADPVFDEQDPEAMKIKSKVEQGFIKGASIGINIDSVSDAPELMMPGQSRATVTGATAAEASICPMPSNDNALALYDATGSRISLKHGNKELNKTLPLIPTTQKTTTDMKLSKTTLTLLKLNALPADPTPDDINESVATLAKERDDANLKLKELEDARKVELKARAEILVDGAIKLKKLTAAEKDEYVKNAIADYAFVEKTLSKMGGPTLPTGNLSMETNEEVDAEGRDKWDFNKWRKEDPQGLLKMKTDDKDAYAKLTKAAKVRT